MQRFSLSIVNIFVFFVLFTWWKKVSETWDRADRQVHWTASGCCCSWLLRDITPAFGYQPTAVAHYHINVCKFDKVKANFASPLLLAVLSWNCKIYFFFRRQKSAQKHAHTHRHYRSPSRFDQSDCLKEIHAEFFFKKRGEKDLFFKEKLNKKKN